MHTNSYISEIFPKCQSYECTKKYNYNSNNKCEERQNKSQCVDCFVKQTAGGHGNGRKLFI